MDYFKTYFKDNTNQKIQPYSNSIKSQMRRNRSHQKLNEDLSTSFSGDSRSDDDILFTNFNSDQNCFVTGNESGFAVYNSDPFIERFHRSFSGGIGIVELLGRSNILALVGGGNHPEWAPNQVIIWDDYQSKIISRLEYSTEVLAVKCRENKILVSLYHKTYVYKFENLALEFQYETYPNPKGISDLSIDGNVLAIIGNNIGTIRIEIIDTHKSHILYAHQNALAQICLSHNGHFLATCSERGTIIRIWETQTGSMIKELRRGIDSANICSLSFNHLNNSLSVLSNKGTIHIFSLNSHDEKNKRSSLSFMKNFLPTYFSSEWSYFNFNIPHLYNGKCAFSKDEPNNIIILTNHGKYYRYQINTIQENANLIQSVNFLNF